MAGNANPDPVKQDLEARHMRVAMRLSPVLHKPAKDILADAYRKADLALQR